MNGLKSVLLLLLFPAMVGCQPPDLIHQNNNCWLNSLTWAFYNMPELKASLLGAGGDAYLKATPPQQEAAKKELAVAQSFTHLVRALDGKKATIEPFVAFQNVIPHDPSGMGDAFSAAVELLGSLREETFLWGSTITPTIKSTKGLAILEVGSPEQLEHLFDAFFGGRDLRSGVRNYLFAQQYPKASYPGGIVPEKLKEAFIKKFNLDDPEVGKRLREDGALMFAQVGPYIIVNLDLVRMVDKNGKLDLYKPATKLLTSSLGLTLSIEPHVTDGLKQKMITEGIPFTYELISSIMCEGWAHYTAYIKDQYDPKQPWYHCNDLSNPQANQVTEGEVKGPWKNNRFPRVLVYRRTGGAGDGSQKTTTAGAEQLAPLASALQALTGKK